QMMYLIVEGCITDRACHFIADVLQVKLRHRIIRLMHEIINSLPTLQRTIMRMKDIEEYETEEIADITGCNPEAIRSNLSRARKKVRAVLL
ncbi:sigma-70 family RNA polymerase sigma factor, partial [Bacteroides cellulosilyticus]